MAVPLDANLPAEDLCELINRADVTSLVYDETKANVALMARKQCPGLLHLIAMEKGTEVPDALYMWELIEKAPARDGYEPKPEDLATIMFTSGTTGKSKGVMLTHYNVVNNGKYIGDHMDLSTADRMMIQVPMFHCFGMVLSMTASMTHGNTMCPLP